MKTYVLMVSNVFPQTHKRKGEPTYFPGKILDEIKIHTIRSNYDLWENRIKEINEGRAILSVRYWFDKPYCSPQVPFREFELDEVGIQKLTFSSEEFVVRFIDGKPCFATAEEIGENDGLSFHDFWDWFKGYDLSKPMAIIHFTDFRYGKI